MLDLSKVIAVIPARGGSRRLPGKNMRELAGKSLVGHAIDHAFAAGLMGGRILVSSDDRATLSYASQVGAVAVERPIELSQGITPPIWNVRHALKVFREAVPHGDVALIVYLQPTSPFRSPADITSALNVAWNTGADAVVTVRVMKERPFEIGFAGRLRMMPRTDSGQAIVAPNGAIYVITSKHLDGGGDWWDGITMAHVMSDERSLDIDVREDFDAAEQLAQTMLKAGAL